MAKKFVRGITDVKTINNQDYDTNNVNDLLSDGQYNYIHRKKGKTEEYHNLTDNIKTISSDNTDLLTVTNNNKTNNTATLSPKHDAQKEQVLESTRNTISIHHGENATVEKTTVDTNPQKVLEHENLISDSEYITLDHQTDVNKTHIKTESLKQELQQLHETKQDVLTAGEGITIEGQTVDTNPQKVLEHENLTVGSGLLKTHQLAQDTTNLSIDYGIVQDKMLASEGITIDRNTIKPTIIHNYGGDLNDLTFNVLLKPSDSATNMPPNSTPFGILQVYKIGNVISQVYYSSNNTLHMRIGNMYSQDVWHEWTSLQTTEQVTH